MLEIYYNRNYKKQKNQLCSCLLYSFETLELVAMMRKAASCAGVRLPTTSYAQQQEQKPLKDLPLTENVHKDV